MKIQKIEIDKINPAAYNPRKDLKPGDTEYEKLKRSINEFDIVEPLVWNKRTGNLVGGHQRLKILRDELKVDKVEVSVVDLDDKREKALNIALNKINGDWDFSKLKELLTVLDDGSFDVSITGFDEQELKDLIDFDGRKGLVGDDDIPPPPKTPQSKLGQIYQCGEHRVMCGDSLDAEYLLPLMDKAKADMVFTDPPYNVSYEEGSDTRTLAQSRRLHRSTQKLGSIKNDKMSDRKFKQFLEDAFDAYHLATKKGASLYVCHADRIAREIQNALESRGFKMRCQIIWAKNTFAWGMSRYKFQHEPIFYCYKKGESDPWYGDKSQSTLWNENKPSANRLHPTMKPVELILRALTNSSKAGDIVLDLFGGAGSTLIAAEKLNRKAYLMEIDPIYVDVIVKRWEEFTGKTAKLLLKP